MLLVMCKDDVSNGKGLEKDSMDDINLQLWSHDGSYDDTVSSEGNLLLHLL